MAVFIPRHRLGSGREQRGASLTQRIEGLSGFRALRSNLAQAKETQAAGLKEKYESNAEVQEWRRKDATTKGLEAVERLVPTAKAITELRTGAECTHEQARKVAENIAYKAERQKGGE